ncbi:DUF4224 domain-containing protein [Avibacterium endocarditidis]|uniref:DUF4224 domain-containing protein n=1 Tax=Avibacterium endocarditidis TaxID=380674 RepID=A0ABX4ZSY5_9PAST|nr:DUF4224 domain-containing protein [Avibacterium endocarditidis]POY42629.1 hypothetical protein C3Z13_04260 [Avibacterium endocarditidis]
MEFLTAEELYYLTGYKQHSRQITYLREQHYTIQGINKFGMPLVIYKDVFGFRRDPSPTIKQQDVKWQPPPM